MPYQEMGHIKRIIFVIILCLNQEDIIFVLNFTDHFVTLCNSFLIFKRKRNHRGRNAKKKVKTWNISKKFPYGQIHVVIIDNARDDP